MRRSRAAISAFQLGKAWAERSAGAQKTVAGTASQVRRADGRRVETVGT